MPLLDQVAVLDELRRAKCRFHHSSEDEIKVSCPFHEEEKPSCSINTESKLFLCHGCQQQGDFISFLAGFHKTARAAIIRELSSRYDADTDRRVDPQVVERFHAAIFEAKELLVELRKRGVSDDAIRKYRIGANSGRVQIPITNQHGTFVNVRKYLPGAKGLDKYRNTRGHGKIRLFPIKQLEYNSILLTGGEIKAIVAAETLNESNIGAITATAGEGKWNHKFDELFAGKTVYVCMDIDNPGKKASLTMCRIMAKHAAWVGEVHLPLNEKKYPHGDINDYVAGGGDLRKLLKDTVEWRAPRVAKKLDNARPISTTFSSATNSETTGKRISFPGIVVAVDQAPYVIPKKLRVTCTQDEKYCALCPVFTESIDEHEISTDDAAVLELLGAPNASQEEALRSEIGVPKRCKSFAFETLEHINAEDARLGPQLEITSQGEERPMQPAVCVGEHITLNEPYIFTGRMHPHPRTQQATLVIDHYEHAEDALDSYRCHDLHRLRVFRPDKWDTESVHTKLCGIYDDLTANVTRIYKRQTMHLLVDLAYHSPLVIKFDGRQVKGWVESLIVGDSAQGKSDTAMGLRAHYGLGEKVESKNATVAGLLGGLQQLGSKWFVSWGAFPSQDRRLLILEELKGATTETISQLTDMRSSGVAELPKIQRRKTHARTRLVVLSNPRGDKRVGHYNYGVEAVYQLIGSPEDVRRFDIAMVVSAEEIDSEELNKLQQHRPEVEHLCTGDLCRSLILWGWTRTPDEVSYTEDARKRIMTEATKLSSEHDEHIPLLDRGSTRYKLARLSASLAVRTFSTDAAMACVCVEDCHVEYIVALLRKLYSSAACGFDAYSANSRAKRSVRNGPAVLEAVRKTAHPEDFIEQITAAEFVDINDIMTWCESERADATILLSVLVRERALTRVRAGYRKTPGFVNLLKGLTVEPNEEEF